MLVHEIQGSGQNRESHPVSGIHVFIDLDILVFLAVRKVATISLLVDNAGNPFLLRVSHVDIRRQARRCRVGLPKASRTAQFRRRESLHLELFHMPVAPRYRTSGEQGKG